MLEFLLTMEYITGERTDSNLMGYALEKEKQRIKRATAALLDKRPRTVGKLQWRRWNA